MPIYEYRCQHCEERIEQLVPLRAAGSIWMGETLFLFDQPEAKDKKGACAHPLTPTDSNV
jgi:uncharacterized protein YlaI